MTARIHWIVAILLAFPGLAKSELSVRVMSPKTKILSKEPLQVQFVWTNNSAAPESVYNTKPISVSIQGARSLKTSKLYRTMAEQTKGTAFRPVILQPGHSYSQTYVPLILAMDVNGKNPWFLFKEEGEYQLTFPDKQGCSLNIQVRKPGIPQDVNAHELFSVGVGQALLGETWRALEQGKQDLKLLARLAGDHPASYLGPYTSIGMADIMWNSSRNPYKINSKQYTGYLNLPLKLDAGHFLREQALFRKARFLLFQSGGRSESRKLATLLAKENPESGYLNELKYLHGEPLLQAPPSQEKQPAKLAITAKLDTHSLEVIQTPAVRAAFSDYWAAVCSGEGEKLKDIVHENYQGSHGSKDNRLKRINRAQKRNKFDAIRVVVTKAAPATALKPLTLGKANQEGWKGNLQIIEFNIGGVDSRKSPDPVSTHSMRTVLMEEQGKWLVVSDEFLGSQQSPKVVLLIQLLMKDLLTDFDSVKILDAGTPSLLSDVLKQKSDLAASTVVSDFKVLSMTMMGSNKNDPLLLGEFVGKSKESTKKYSYKLQLSAPKQGQTFLLHSLSVDSE